MFDSAAWVIVLDNYSAFTRKERKIFNMYMQHSQVISNAARALKMTEGDMIYVLQDVKYKIEAIKKMAFTGQER